jgi:hypothetical protein
LDKERDVQTTAAELHVGKIKIMVQQLLDLWNGPSLVKVFVVYQLPCFILLLSRILATSGQIIEQAMIAKFFPILILPKSP